jgi:hypothetical protein
MKLRLISQHDYISLVHPNWRFTTARRGEKGSGLLSRDNSGFDRLAGYVADERRQGKTNGDIMRSLTDVSVLSRLWPEWDKEVVVPVFAPGDTARFDPSVKLVAKKYPGEYMVASVSRKCAFLRLPDGTTCGFDKELLQKVAASS